MLRATTITAFAMPTTITPGTAPPTRITAEVVTINGSARLGTATNGFCGQSAIAGKCRTFGGPLSDNRQAAGPPAPVSSAASPGQH